MIGADGKPYVQRADGTVIGPDGSVMLGADGKPLVIPEGSRLSF